MATTRVALEEAMGSDYALYTRLLESFLCGRMTKEELEGGLRTVLKDSLPNYDLHNKYVGLVLEKLAAAEVEALSACRTSEDHIESATLSLSAIPLTSTDQTIFRAALNRPTPRIPLVQAEEEMTSRFQAELLAAEKNAGRPLLAQISGVIPDSYAIKALLMCWLRAYELDASSVEEEHVALVMQGLEEYLISSILAARDRVIPGPDGVVEISGDAFAAAMALDHFPLLIANLIHVQGPAE